MLLLIKLLSDFGLLILIWIVQIIIYPSFRFYAPKDLLIWHEKYTKLITFIVLPLMMVQLSSTIILTYTEFSWNFGVQLVLIILIWFSTFLQAVPLHNKISSGKDIVPSSIKLVRVNLLRTILWTIIFLMSFFSTAKEIIR